jgi:Icc-related predicted phosphoesterase
LVALGGDYGPTEDQAEIVALASRFNNVVAVFGNHDHQQSGTRILHGSAMELGGYTIGGIGGSLPSGGYPFEVDDTGYQIALQKLGKVDILLSHEPPLGTKLDILYGGKHIGSKAVFDYIRTTQPKLVMCGHVHESIAIDKVGNTVLVNPGAFQLGNFADIALGEDVEVALGNFYSPVGRTLRIARVRMLVSLKRLRLLRSTKFSDDA